MAIKQMSETIGQVNSAILNISATAQESASSSEEILACINETTVAIEEVAKSAQSQAELAEKFNIISFEHTNKHPVFFLYFHV